MSGNHVEIFTSPETWNQLRVLYESGEYPNLNALYEKHKDNYVDMPNILGLSRHAATECWEKGRFNEVKTEAKRQNYVKLYAELGMDDREQARYRVECVKAADDLKKIIAKLYDALNGLDPYSQMFTETLSKIKVLTDTMFKGMNTSLTALQEIGKITGSYAPEKDSRTKTTNGKTTPLEDMTEEEILQDLKRMQAAGINLTEIPQLNTSSDAQKGPNEL